MSGHFSKEDKGSPWLSKKEKSKRPIQTLLDKVGILYSNEIGEHKATISRLKEQMINLTKQHRENEVKMAESHKNEVEGYKKYIAEIQKEISKTKEDYDILKNNMTKRRKLDVQSQTENQEEAVIGKSVANALTQTETENHDSYSCISDTQDSIRCNYDTLDAGSSINTYEFDSQVDE